MFPLKLQYGLKNPKIFVEQTVVDTYPIYTINLSEQINCETLANFLLEEKNKIDQKYSTTNRIKGIDKNDLDYLTSGWNSDYILENFKQKDFQFLIDIILSSLTKIDPFYSYYIAHFNFNVMLKEASFKEHDHGIDDMVAVFYPLVQPDSSPLTIKNNQKDIDLQVKTGDLIFFSGKVKHLVHPCKNTKERISISFNCSKHSITQRGILKRQPNR